MATGADLPGGGEGALRRAELNAGAPLGAGGAGLGAGARRLTSDPLGFVGALRRGLGGGDLRRGFGGGDRRLLPDEKPPPPRRRAESLRYRSLSSGSASITTLSSDTKPFGSFSVRSSATEDSNREPTMHLPSVASYSKPLLSSSQVS